ncbi:hypothetical protein DL766_007115 [Monosporascus sp. MC13-8B]|uniref:NACHT domain-containing protein n=1 Tax=Monosporascus cannonballus TaxID=155416 RepID=A0ABY0H9R4_9PEZI|nr:hypothetical protein DL762_003949 [Monosporascus cannonballus]RYO94816.1 hypothetical protein DL763_003920 [Monosporascus cannonballus]RYP25310.1 hypothetical protein DL766_007115 [Monosporascus sp. MC13-8B]
MDPITAFSLAANVCQFVEFTVKVVSKGNKLHSSPNDLLVEHADLYATSRNVIDLNNRLVASAKEHSQHVGSLATEFDDEIERACKAMNHVASDLLKVLDDLRMPSHKGRWRSMRQAVKAMIGKSAVDKMKNELTVQRRRLETALLSSLWAKLDLFLSTEGGKQGKEYVVPFPPETRKSTVRLLFDSSEAEPPPWQTNLVNKVLQNFWKPEEKGHVAMFSEEISSTVECQCRRQRQDQIIRQIHFEDMSDREYRIPAAHQDTFHWIFAGPNERHARRWCLFAPWLQSAEKLYWITGKPGSGKSTLMKYLSRHPQMRRSLSGWSKNLPLVTAHFYFWNSGSQAQMSLEGFYRTAIHAILSKLPQWVPEVLPNRWANSSLFGQDMRDWTIQELQEAFQKLLKKSGHSYRLCLFIDGLDEYGGDHSSLVEELSHIMAVHDVKLCVASRPWPVFERAFSTGAHLMLQDLTFPDIVRFTWSKLHNHRGFQNLVALETDYAGNLILDIADKAEGVFLWVDLVTKSLLQGLTNADRVADLQRRLEELPAGLEELYSKMFDSIDPFYMAHASRYLQIASAATGQLSALTFYFADEEDADHSLAIEPGPLTEPQRQARYEAIKTRLNACCRGFLEIPNPAPTYDPDYVPGQETRSPASPSSVAMDLDHYDPAVDLDPDIDMGADPVSVGHGDEQQTNVAKFEEDVVENFATRIGIEVKPMTVIPEPDRKVTYLHRTAKDFLESPKIRARILSMSPPGFNPYPSILDAFLLLMKTLPLEKIDQPTLWHMVRQSLGFAALADSATEVSLTRHLDELDRTASRMFHNHNLCEEDRHWTTTRWTSTDARQEVGFLSLAAEFNLKRYIMSKIELGMSIFQSGNGRPLLDYVVEDYANYPSLSEPSGIEGVTLPSLRIIKALLARGEDPNFRFNDSTTWERVLDGASNAARAREMDDTPRQAIMSHWADIIEAFITHDADPLMNRNSPLGSRIREILGHMTPQRAKDLEKRLKQTKRRWSTLGKFITPRNWKLEKPTFETTSLPVLNRLDTATVSPVEWSEFSRLAPSGCADSTETSSFKVKYRRPGVSRFVVQNPPTPPPDYNVGAGPLDRNGGSESIASARWSESTTVAVKHRLFRTPVSVETPLEPDPDAKRRKAPTDTILRRNGNGFTCLTAYSYRARPPAIVDIGCAAWEDDFAPDDHVTTFTRGHYATKPYGR